MTEPTLQTAEEVEAVATAERTKLLAEAATAAQGRPPLPRL